MSNFIVRLYMLLTEFAQEHTDSAHMELWTFLNTQILRMFYYFSLRHNIPINLMPSNNSWNESNI